MIHYKTIPYRKVMKCKRSKMRNFDSEMVKNRWKKGFVAVAFSISDMWKVTCNMWHATHDTWYLTCSTNFFFFCKYISFATLGSYVKCLRAKVIKFPWSVIFDRFWVEDHPQIPFWYENCVLMWNSTFCERKKFSFKHHCIMGKTILQKVLFHIIKHFIFFTNQEA